MATQRASREHGLPTDGSASLIKSSLSEHRICWRHDIKSGVLANAWPSQPDSEKVLSLARRHLPSSFVAEWDETTISEDDVHKLYYFWSSRKPTLRYLMRVAKPLEPFFKTESEVATMAYVRKHTSIPVPDVIAYESSASNPLGFEWILMKMMEGVTLEQAWAKMQWPEKLRLTEEMACYVKELLSLRFTLLGSIYFADVWNEVGYPPLSSSRDARPSHTADASIGIDGEFVIGRMVAMRFFMGKRALLRADRGPFETARELFVAETKLLGQRIRHLSPVPGTDYYCKADQRFSEDAAEALPVFDELEKAVLDVFSNSDGPEDAKVLWHDDLSFQNILVDPDTFKITGVVDWQAICIVPAWETGDGVPDFLQGFEVAEPPPLGSVPEEEEEGLAPIRQDWELVLLRRKYAEILGSLYHASSVDKDTLWRKRELAICLAIFEDMWKTTRAKLTGLFNNLTYSTTPSPRTLSPTTPSPTASSLIAHKPVDSHDIGDLENESD